MSKASARLQQLSKISLIFICVLLMLLVALLDYFSGPAISTSIFYLIPISISAWFINRRAGLLFAINAAILWFLADYLTNPQIILSVTFWNATVRLGFFLIVVFSFSALHRSRKRQEDLMSFVIHDLRAPLGNMLTAFDLLSDSATAENGNLEVVQLGQSSGTRMMVLVDSLLDLSRLESGQVQLHPENVQLDALIEESIAQLILTAEIKNITFARQFDRTTTAVLADPTLTQRVIVNLLNNAIKFSPMDGVITVQTADAPTGGITVSVIDQGPGIPAEWQKRVFAKYGQVTGGKSGGSGLGLTFCKLAVEAQNGRIWLESEPGSGTILRFTLPKA